MSARDTYNRWVEGQNFDYPRHLRENEVSQREMQRIMSVAPDSLLDAYSQRLGLEGRTQDIRDEVNAGRLKMYVDLEPSEFNYAFNRGAKNSDAIERAAGFYMPRTAETDTSRIFFPSTEYNDYFPLESVGHEFGHEILGHSIGGENVPEIDAQGMRNFALMGRMGNQFPTPNELLEDAGGDTSRAIQEYKQIYGKHDGFVDNPYDDRSRLKSMFGNILGDKSDFDKHTHYHPDMTDRDFKENFAQQWFDNATGGLRLKMANPDLFERRPAPVQTPEPAAPLLPSATTPNFMSPFNPSEGESFFDFLSF